MSNNIYNKFEEMKIDPSLRCPQCKKLLIEFVQGEVRIMCSRCKTHITATIDSTTKKIEKYAKSSRER